MQILSSNGAEKMIKEVFSVLFFRHKISSARAPRLEIEMAQFC